MNYFKDFLAKNDQELYMFGKKMLMFSRTSWTGMTIIIRGLLSSNGGTFKIFLGKELCIFFLRSFWTKDTLLPSQESWIFLNTSWPRIMEFLFYDIFFRWRIINLFITYWQVSMDILTRKYRFIEELSGIKF